MNIQTLIDQDPRVIEIRTKYQSLIQHKNELIKSISNVEADIIKLSGSYEVIAKEIVSKFQPVSAIDTVEPPPVDPGDEVVNEENEDDGFAEAAYQPSAEEINVTPTPDAVVPDAENTRPMIED